jgi:hypothetical protein
MNAAIEQRKLIDNLNRASMSCLAEEYKVNKVNDEEFQTKMRDLTQKQNKLFNGDVTLHRQRDRILSEIDDVVIESGKDERRVVNFLSCCVYDVLRIKPPGRDGEQIQFGKDL